MFAHPIYPLAGFGLHLYTEYERGHEKDGRWESQIKARERAAARLRSHEFVLG